MDRVTLEGSLFAANARVMAGQQALRDQRAQVRELEQWGLDASLAKALLHIYEESYAMSILERRRLYGVLAVAPPREPALLQDNELLVEDDVTYHRQAA